MRFLVVGLGSMGKRRIRNLQALGYDDIAGFDLREDRRNESVERYGIEIYDQFERARSEFSPGAMIISTSPQHHMHYAWIGLQNKIPCFIEASVVEAEQILALSHEAKSSNVLMAPSCTMRYFPGPKKVKELIKAGVIGTPLNINYQTGQYLEDWHPWEPIDSYYVSQRETGGAREIVPFELTWLNDIFGVPVALSCMKTKLTNLNADIDDIYHCLLQYPNHLLANITIDVVSRPLATRELRIMGTEGVLVMSSDEQCVRYSNLQHSDWVKYMLAEGKKEQGYINAEEPYIEELSDFISAVNLKSSDVFQNTLEDDWRVLNVLSELEMLVK